MLFVASMLLAACSTGDGKTLTPPAQPVEPVSPIAPGPTADPNLVDDAGTIPSVPLDAPTLPGEFAQPDLDFTLFAPWSPDVPIDVFNTCDGVDVSPALSWSEPPAGTIELAISLVDESTADGVPFVHWVIAGLNPTETSLAEGMVPLGAIQAINSFGNVGYDGPCPPPGDPAHVYRLTLYALGQQTELADETPASDLLDFIGAVAIAATDVPGTFAR